MTSGLGSDSRTRGDDEGMFLESAESRPVDNNSQVRGSTANGGPFVQGRERERMI